jgi:hypothetical protein
MKNEWIGSWAVLLAAATWCHAQTPASPPPAASGPQQSVPADASAGSHDSSSSAPSGLFPFLDNGRERDPAAERVWVNAEYLLWWIKGMGTPPLLGSVPVSVLTSSSGTLPAGSVATIFGDSQLHFGAFSGGRISGGAWLDQGQHWGIDGSYFFLERKTRGFAADSTPTTVVGPLFQDSTNGALTIIYPINPTQATESVSASASTRLWGLDANARTRCCIVGNNSLDLMGGYRQFSLAGALDTASAIRFSPNGLSRTFNDHFDSKNQFYGGQVGAALDLRDGPWSINVIGKFALGGVHEVININGVTTDTLPRGLSQRFVGGVLAQPTNIGHYTRSRFCYLPEATVNGGYYLTRNLQAFIGYNTIYLNKVVRPGDAIDFQVNPSQIHGLVVTNPMPGTRPLATFRESTFWAQGINFGLGFEY